MNSNLQNKSTKMWVNYTYPFSIKFCQVLDLQARSARCITIIILQKKLKENFYYSSMWDWLFLYQYLKDKIYSCIENCSSKDGCTIFELIKYFFMLTELKFPKSRQCSYRDAFNFILHGCYMDSIVETVLFKRTSSSYFTRTRNYKTVYHALYGNSTLYQGW